ncbi:2467_t:CDS:2 [Entrophospora sp. SA101]|nr:2467_t:CDS:2 [Entrophospora sp. SA101]
MQLWNNWLKWFDFTLEKKSVLLIDNCPAHTDGSHLGLKIYNRTLEIADEPTSNDILEELVDGLRKIVGYIYWTAIVPTNETLNSELGKQDKEDEVFYTEKDAILRDLNQAYNDDKFTEENSIHKNNLKRKLEDDELPDYDELAFLFNDENALGEESRLPLANDSKVNFIGIREHTVY